MVALRLPGLEGIPDFESALRKTGLRWRIHPGAPIEQPHPLEDSVLKNQSRSLLSRVALSLLLLSIETVPSRAQSEASLAKRIEKVMNRPEFAHANFGIEFYSLEAGKVVYALNTDKLFVPASTTKILTEGTLLASLGADYRFHTRIFHRGPVDSKGKLKGDLILVASGDPNLSNRIRPDGT